MVFYRHPQAFSVLRSHYWMLRSLRRHDLAGRRKWYRRIEKEKTRLAGLGFSVEHLRLYCRYMARPLPDCLALDRLKAFELMLVEFARISAAAEHGRQDVVPVVIEPL